ncbi:MAG: ECF transporter S component [Propionibacteriaceae bacterium]|nr:ECF transporter S component [Propionibacteriaceae bacterium]
MTNQSAAQRLAVPLGTRSVVTLTIASLAGLALFAWPLVIPAREGDASQTSAQAPYFFVIVVGLVVMLAVAQVLDKGLDPKALAMLGVLSAVNAALRPLSAGSNGVELVFFMLILAGRVFGPGFGFLLGCTSIFASGLLTAGVGPWLPFQMLAAAWVGLLAGLLPQRIGGRTIRGAAEIGLLAVFGAAAAYLFGALMNLWFWPFMAGQSLGANAGLSYVPGAALFDNLHRFVVYTLATSTALWDTGRAITNVVLVIIVGPGVLAVFRRALRRASFAPDVTFSDALN